MDYSDSIISHEAAKKAAYAQAAVLGASTADLPELVALHNRLRKLGEIAYEVSQRLGDFRDRALGGQSCEDACGNKALPPSGIIGQLNDAADGISMSLDRLYATTSQLNRIV